jgi:hypothetical protein
MQLDALSLSEIRVVNPWSSARHGALLRMSVGRRLEIGVRCNYKATDATSEALVIVSGENTGKIAIADLNGPALDLSELLEIVAIDPTVLGAITSLEPGSLYRYGRDRAGYFIRFDALRGHGNGFICIADETGENRLGEHFRSLPSDELIYIARTVDVRSRAKPSVTRV